MAKAARSTGGLVSGRFNQALARDDCPFCLDNADIVIAENQQFRAIYNRAPIVPGHVLVIPRRHVSTLRELTEDEVGFFFVFARRITSDVLKAYRKGAYDWILQEGEAAGQTVEHLHLHVIPRIEGDLESPGSWFERLTGTRVAVDSRDRQPLTRDEMRREVRFILSQATG